MSEPVRDNPGSGERNEPCRGIGAYEKLNGNRQWPYDHYRELRKIGPIIEDFSGRRFWIVTGADLVEEVLKNPVFIKNPSPELMHMLPDGGIYGTGLEQKQASMVTLDPPHHTRIRRLVNKAFSGVEVRKMSGAVRETVDQLLNTLEPRGEMEFVKDYAEPIPSTVISSILGVPKADQELLNQYSNSIVSTITGEMQNKTSGSPEYINAVKAAADFNTYLLELFDDRRKTPRDDLITRLVHAETEDGTLSNSELLVNTRVLYIAGHETTIKTLSNIIAVLFRHRDQLERIKADPSLVKSSLNELIRYDGSVQQLRRVAREDVILGGKQIKAGELMVVLLGSANHDEKHCEHPQVLDISRKQVKNLSFGAGVHFCLGFQLARLEIEIALSSLFQRIPNIELHNPYPRWGTTSVFRGIDRLDMYW